MMQGMIGRWRSLAPLALALAVALTAWLGVGVGNGATQTTVSVIWSPNERVGFETLKTNFERAHPEIKLNVQYAGVGAGYGPQLRGLLQAGSAPDVMYIVPGATALYSAQTLGRDGYLDVLAGKKWDDRVPKSLKPQVTVGGKLYGIPLLESPVAVGYNKAMFAQLGLKPPGTFREFLSLCRKITAAGKVPYVWAGTPTNVNINPTLQQAVRTGASEKDFPKLRAQRKTTFSGSAQWRHAIQSIVDMNSAGCFQRSPQGTGVQQAFVMFATGQALMSTANPGFINQVKAINSKLDISGFPMPAAKAKDTRLWLTPTTVVGLNKASKVKPAARTFIEFIASDEQMRAYSKAANAVSPWDAARSTGFPRWLEGAKTIAKRGNVAEDPGWQFPAGLLETVLAPGVQGLFTGQKTARQVLADLDAGYDRLAKRR